MKLFSRIKPNLFALLITAFFLLVTSVVKGDAGSISIDNWATAVFGSGYNKESFDHKTINDINITITTGIIGCLSENCPKETRSGAAGVTSQLITTLFSNPPASGVAYMAGILNDFGIIKPAYAQTGVGFEAFAPILPLWRAFRNIAYTMFVFVFIITGFAIMFKAKMSPQVTVTIQSALPKIVVSLLLVTFSYAIAGLLVDLSYVLYFVVLRGIEGMGGITNIQADTLANDYLNGGFLQTLMKVIGQGVGAITNLIRGIF